MCEYLIYDLLAFVMLQHFLLVKHIQEMFIENLQAALDVGSQVMLYMVTF